MSIDIDALRARIRARNAAPTHACEDRPEVDADLEALLAALEAARADVKRLTEEDEDLRGSAEIWIRLYDASLARANRAEAEAQELRRDLPSHVKQLYSALDRVSVLTEAVNAVVRECDVCARAAQEGATVPDRLKDVCARCRRALDVLQSAAGLVRSNP